MKCGEMVDRASVQRGVVQAPAKCSIMDLPEVPACRLLPAAGTSLLFESHNQHDEVDDEEQDDGDFEQEHPAVIVILLEKLVHVVEGLEFFVDGAVPVGEVKTGGDGLIDAGEVPVAEEFGDVGKLVGEACQVDADFGELAHGLAAGAEVAGGDVAVGAFDGFVEDTVVGFEFGELEVGQLHDVDDLGEIGGLIEDQGGVPVDDDEVVVVVAEIAGGGFAGFLLGEVVDVGFLGEEGGDLAAVLVEPLLAAEVVAVGGGHGGVDAEDGVGFFVGEAFGGTDVVGLEFAVDVFGESADFVVERAVGEAEIVVGDEFGEGVDPEGDMDGDGDGADGEELDGVFDADGAVGADAFDGREADHLRAVEEELAGAAFGGIDFELCDGLAEQFAYGLADHFVGDVEGVDVDDFAGVVVDGGGGAVGSGLGGACGGAGHKMTGILCWSGGDAQSSRCIRNAFLMQLL